MMRSVLGLVVVFYVYIAGPALCLAGVDLHACGCSEASCPEHSTQPCRTTHECHDDPCPDLSRPPEQDDSGIDKPAAHTHDGVATLSETCLAVPSLTAVPAVSAPPAAAWRELFASQGLPLLI